MFLLFDLTLDTDCEQKYIYLELDKNNYEIRKIEIFKNGKIGFALDNIEYRGSFLSEDPHLPLEEMLSFIESSYKEVGIVKEISKQEFELVWGTHIKGIRKIIGNLFYRNKLIELDR